MVEPLIVRPIVLSDPADDPVLYTAADGKADILYTRNIRHFQAVEVRSFCVTRGIRVMTDLDILRDLLEAGPTTSHDSELLPGCIKTATTRSAARSPVR